MLPTSAVRPTCARASLRDGPRLRGAAAPGSASAAYSNGAASLLKVRACYASLGAALLLCGVSACREPAPAVGAILRTLPLSAPSATRAGEDLVIQIHGTREDEARVVDVLLWTSYGPRAMSLEVRAARGEAAVVVPGTALTIAGSTAVVVRGSHFVGEVAVTVLPGQVVDPVVPLVGARSIPADGKHFSMCTVVPEDRFGNLLPDGIPVTIRSRRSDGTSSTLETEVRHGIAWERIFSGIRAGRTTVTAAVGLARGPEADFFEIAGWPQSVQVRAAPLGESADGRRLLTLSTEELRDINGNLLPDGTLVTFVSPRPHARFAPAVTIRGVAQTVVLAPRDARPDSIGAAMFGAAIRTSPYAWQPAFNGGVIPVGFSQVGSEVRLRAGPLLTVRDHFVPDGTHVEVRLQDQIGRVAAYGAVSERGYAELSLNAGEFSRGRLLVEVVLGDGRGSASVELR